MNRSKIFLAAGPTLGAVLFFTLQTMGWESSACWTAAIAITCAVWWIFEPIPIPATSLLPIATFPGSGHTDTQRDRRILRQSSGVIAFRWIHPVHGDGKQWSTSPGCTHNGQSGRWKQQSTTGARFYGSFGIVEHVDFQYSHNLDAAPRSPGCTGKSRRQITGNPLASRYRLRGQCRWYWNTHRHPTESIVPRGLSTVYGNRSTVSNLDELGNTGCHHLCTDHRVLSYKEPIFYR